MSLASQISDLATRIATEIKAVRSERSGTLKRVGAHIVTTTSGNITALTNQGTVNIASAVNGRTYRVYATAQPRNDTAGSFTELYLKYGIAASTGGTQFQGGIKDHRLANRPEALTVVGEFTYVGTTGDNINVVLVLSAGSGITVNASSTTRVTALIVDEVLP